MTCVPGSGRGKQRAVPLSCSLFCVCPQRLSLCWLLRKAAPCAVLVGRVVGLPRLAEAQVMIVTPGCMFHQRMS